MGEPQGWRDMERVFGAQWILLVLGLLGAAGCNAGTTLVPGDPSHFDPVAAFPKVAVYAGPSTKLLALDAKYVREDGTVDLDARYMNTEERPVWYTFVQPQLSSGETDVPVGVRTVPPSKFTEVWIGIRRTDLDHFDGGWFHGGMSRATDDEGAVVPDPFHPVPQSFDTATPPPRCPFANLWAIARQRGAPAGAVAVIAYDPTGYHFRIDGTPFKLDFDTDCKVKN